MAILSYNYQQVFTNILFSTIKEHFSNSSLELKLHLLIKASMN